MERFWGFIGGTEGAWRVRSVVPVFGEGLGPVERLAVRELGVAEPAPASAWCLRGVRSNERYVTRQEREGLAARQADLGRPEAACAALIPIRKAASWWALAQDERRAIMEERSRHIAIGSHYLPAVARRLYHSRDLNEPFDFLTWFEFAMEHTAAFEDLLGHLRASEEWRYVDREVDIRLDRVE